MKEAIKKYSFLFFGSLMLILLRLVNGNLFFLPLFGILIPISYLTFFRFCNKGYEYVIGISAFIISNFIYVFNYISGFFGNLSLFLIVLIFGIPYFVDYLVRDKKRHIYRLFFPFSFVSLELIFSFLNVDDFISLTELFFNSLYLKHSVSIIGVYGLSFIVLYFASSISDIVKDNFKLETLKKSIVSILILIGFIFYGSIVHNTEEKNDKLVKVSYASGPYTNVLENGEYEEVEIEENIRVLNETTLKAKNDGSKILVYAEEAFFIKQESYDYFLGLIKEKAKEYGMYIIATFDLSSSVSENKLVIIDYNGEIAGEYLKHKLIPIMETPYYKKGSGNITNIDFTIDGISISASVFICYDADFTNYVSKIKDDTDILFVPSWDWETIKDYHKKVIGLRALEYGVSVLKPTYDGYNLVCDRYGNIYSSIDTNDLGYGTTNTVMVPINKKNTIYRRISPYINYIYPIGFILITSLHFAIFKNDNEEDENNDVSEVLNND